MGGWSKTLKRAKTEAKNVEKNVNNELRRFRERCAPSKGGTDQACDSCANSAAKSPTNVENSSTIVGGVIALLKTPSTTYPRNPLGLQPGRAFILNHTTFADETLGERIGSDVDISRMEKVFETFDMTNTTIRDGTKYDIARVMAEAEQLNFASYSCLFLVIMTHGYENGVLAAKDGNYSLYRDVLFPMLRNESLVGKPKILFVQSCKGITDLALTVDSSNFRSLPTKEPDEILQFHSCVEGYVSYRTPSLGSIFIQTVCNKLTELGDTEDIRVICSHVIDTVKDTFANMQIPMMHTNLTKPFILGHYKK